MIQYFAGGSISDIRPINTLRYKNVLISFAYLKGITREYMIQNRYKFDNVLIDSGAFTFWNSGKYSMDKLQEYMTMLKKDNWEKYIAFDKVFDPIESKKNYDIMLKADLTPIPCFHINTDINLLKYYLDKSEHIAIGGMVTAPNIDGNLETIWDLILKTNKNCKIHGLGVSNINTMLKYPWHSVDSSSYTAICKFARANVWNGKFLESKDVFDFLQKKFNINVDEIKLNDIRDFLFMWQMEQYNQMIDYVNEKQKNKDFKYLTQQYKLFDL